MVGDDHIYNKDAIINSLYSSYNNSNNITRFPTSKPEKKINIIKKINEFNSVEKYILKADQNIKEIRHEA